MPRRAGWIVPRRASAVRRGGPGPDARKHGAGPGPGGRGPSHRHSGALGYDPAGSPDEHGPGRHHHQTEHGGGTNMCQRRDMAMRDDPLRPSRPHRRARPGNRAARGDTRERNDEMDVRLRRPPSPRTRRHTGSNPIVRRPRRRLCAPAPPSAPHGRDPLLLLPARRLGMGGGPSDLPGGRHRPWPSPFHRRVMWCPMMPRPRTPVPSIAVPAPVPVFGLAASAFRLGDRTLRGRYRW